jgi:hypothetical protein
MSVAGANLSTQRAMRVLPAAFGANENQTHSDPPCLEGRPVCDLNPLAHCLTLDPGNTLNISSTAALGFDRFLGPKMPPRTIRLSVKKALNRGGGIPALISKAYRLFRIPPFLPHK